MTDTVVRARIDPGVKNKADQVLKDMGLTLSDGIRLFLHQVITDQALPFLIKTPTAVTVAALQAIEKEQALELTTLEQLAKDWKEG